MIGNHEVTYFCPFPDYVEHRILRRIDMSEDEWRKLLRQLDLVETEILQKAEHGGLVKAIVRKTQRRIEQRVSWEVYKRDGYKCRYCGVDGVPLTVDHLVLWEEGGPSIPENLVTACRPCNKLRGRMPYHEWLASKQYLKLSDGVGGGRPGITHKVKLENEKLVYDLDTIPRRYSERKTRK
jgi:hypothetical protein